MELKVVGTGSSGNAYILSDGISDLILDAGMSIKEIKQALGFNVTKIRGVLISHIHKDHTQALEKLLMSGVLAYMNPTVKEVCADYYNARSVKPFEVFRLAENITGLGFDVPHDNVPCYGYYLKWDDRRILYLTDLEYCPIDLSKITPTDVIVECNYCEDMVDMEADNIRHKLLGHMGLKACKDFIKHVASIELKNVILCHRGLDTSDPDEITKTISTVAETAHVYVARKGLTIGL